MDASEHINPIHIRDSIVIVSFVLGLTTLIFPTISIVYLVVANGGPGYLQSLFCGIPVAMTSILAGIVSLVERNKINQAKSWMAKSGIIFGSLYFVIALILVFILLFPYLSGSAH